MSDPKFGYHWIWIYPVLVIAIIVESIIYLYEKIVEFYRKFQMRRMLKKNPDIKELTKLAGIK
jgi:hypothetical protein